MKRIIVSLALLLSCAFAVNVSAASDGTPPTIESIEVLTKEVAPGGKVKIKVTASDDVSGIYAISFTFKSPSGNSDFRPILWPRENNPLNHTYIFETEEINNYAEYGEWKLSYAYTEDLAGNKMSYYSNKAENPFMQNISFTVDPNAPKEEVEIDDGFKALESKTDIPINKEFTIKFTLNLDIKTLTEGNIYVLDPSGNRVPLMFIVDRGEAGQTSAVTIAPLHNYRSATTYTLYVKDVKSTSGKVLEQKTKMKFTTK